MASIDYLVCHDFAVCIGVCVCAALFGNKKMRFFFIFFHVFIVRCYDSDTHSSTSRLDCQGLIEDVRPGVWTAFSKVAGYCRYDLLCWFLCACVFFSCVSIAFDSFCTMQ